MPHPRRLGSDAEDRAARFLMDQNMTIVTRRFKGRRGELDLVALDGETLVFVEVRFRAKGEGKPEESVRRAKRERIRLAAREYLAKHPMGERCTRFDLVAVDPDGIRHHRDAFRD